METSKDDRMSRREKKLEFPWLDKSDALTVLRIRRNSRGQPTGASITRECCTRVGWCVALLVVFEIRFFLVAFLVFFF